MESHHNHLITVRISDLRPTQITVGLIEVDRKRAEWRSLKPKERERRLAEHWIPAVRGSKGRCYIVDHHHLVLALHEEGVESVRITILDDLSWLDTDRFWRTMEFHQRAHPYDERGRRRDFDEIPRRVTALADDPYRSLAGLARAAGAFAKDAAPFAEFLWADYFRPLISAKLVRRSPDEAVTRAVKLAHQADARYLPGWAGRSENSR